MCYNDASFTSEEKKMSDKKPHYRTLLAAELRQVEELLLALPGPVTPQVTEAITGLITSGGKRLRPALVLLAAHLTGADMERALPAAAAVELLHTATLVHDDLIDGADLRRSAETLNVQWGPAATVLAGDLLFAQAARLATRAGSARLMEHFAETLVVICSGEMQQLFRDRGAFSPLTAYYERIHAKTASLFGLALACGPLLADAPEPEVEAIRHFGHLVGQAFQIADDLLDFEGETATLGKPGGADLRQGLVTLPVIHYLELHPEDDRVASLLREPEDEGLLHALLADLRASPALERTRETARKHVQEALPLLEHYPPTPHRDALAQIAHFAIERRY